MTHVEGFRDKDQTEPVDTDTVFQAASVSKPLFSTVLMRYRELHGLDIDADINTLLTSWQLPEHPWSGKSDVTLRRLLSHTAGTTVHGFGGQLNGDPVPSLTEILLGSHQANTEALLVDIEPGAGFRYSGGGYVLAQLALEDVSGSSLEALASAYLFEPLDMTRSSFSQPLAPSLRDNAAVGYGPRGLEITGGSRSYGALSAGGLWTTPSDILKWASSIWRAMQGQDGEILSTASAAEMFSSSNGRVGLGLFLGSYGDNEYFRHSGSNAGFESEFIVFNSGGDGIAVMTNGNKGYVLIKEIIHRAAEVFDWPGVERVTRVAVRIEPTELRQYVGTFTAVSPFEASFEVSLDGEALMLDAPDAGFLVANLRFYPESDTSFFSTEGSSLVFEKNAEGSVSSLSFDGFISAAKQN
jgi:CubicO group peptidase (beta-lactamase class C family)